MLRPVSREAIDIIKKKGMNRQDTSLIPTQEDLWVILEEEEILDLVMEEAEVEVVAEEEENPVTIAVPLQYNDNVLIVSKAFRP